MDYEPNLTPDEHVGVALVSSPSEDSVQFHNFGGSYAVQFKSSSSACRTDVSPGV